MDDSEVFEQQQKVQKMTQLALKGLPLAKSSLTSCRSRKLERFTMIIIAICSTFI